MKTALHLFGKGENELAKQVIDLQRAEQDCKVEVAELEKAQVDYRELLEKIFAADSVHIW